MVLRFLKKYSIINIIAFKVIRFNEGDVSIIKKDQQIITFSNSKRKMIGRMSERKGAIGVIKESDKALIISQWQTCVEMANNISARRDTINSIFLSLHIAIVTALTYGWEVRNFILPTCGIVSAILWILIINNYKRLNTEKYRIINQMEKFLPVQPFTIEWASLKKERYKNQTTLERFLPIMFILIYVLVLFSIICNKGGMENA